MMYSESCAGQSKCTYNDKSGNFGRKTCLGSNYTSFCGNGTCFCKPGTRLRCYSCRSCRARSRKRRQFTFKASCIRTVFEIKEHNGGNNTRKAYSDAISLLVVRGRNSHFLSRIIKPALDGIFGYVLKTCDLFDRIVFKVKKKRRLFLLSRECIHDIIDYLKHLGA